MRHRPGRDLEEPPRRHPDRRRAARGAAAADGGAARELREKRPTFTHRAWLDDRREVARSSTRSATARGGDAQAAVRARAAARPARRPRRDLDDRRRPAPDVGRAVAAQSTSRGASITSGGLGTMGFGFPAALGAKLGRPDATVVCIDGDGCFQMTLQELATAVDLQDPGRSSASSTTAGSAWCASGRSCSTTSASRRRTCSSTVPDYKKLAEAYGALGFRVDREEDVDAAIMARGRQRAALRHRLPRRPRGEGLPDGAGRRRLGRHRSTRRGSTTTTSGSRRASDGRRTRTQHAPHPVRAGREPARRAVARAGALLAARLQHREPRGRAHRARGSARASRSASTARRPRSIRSSSSCTS